MSEICAAAAAVSVASPLQLIIADLYGLVKSWGMSFANYGYNVLEIDVDKEPQLASEIVAELTEKLSNDPHCNHLFSGCNGPQVVFRSPPGKYCLSTVHGDITIKYSATKILVYRWRVHIVKTANIPRPERPPGLFWNIARLLGLWYVKGTPLGTALNIYVSDSDILLCLARAGGVCFESNNVVKKAIEEIHSKSSSPTHFVSHYGPRDDCWRFVAARAHRVFDDAKFTDEMKNFISDVNDFRGSAAAYAAQGHHYRRGYLLFGPPGCGKTTSAEIIATEYQMPVYSLNLAGSKMCNEHLSNLVKTLPPHSILLFDEIDKQFRTLSARPKKEVSFDELLSSLDGIVPLPTGCIVVMTANNDNFLPTSLREAFFRPGRVDKMIHFATKYL
jgi:hypothetical protein